MQRFLTEVKGVLPAGSIVTEALQRAVLGRDASFYRLVPQAVLKVHNETEVARVLQSAQQHQVPVTFRAAGTSLSGQAVSDSVLVRLSLGHGNWVDMQLLDGDGSAVRMGPGVIGGQANSLLLPLGRRLGPDPASVESAMVGGIVANNASGMCCGVAQNSYHTLVEVRAVFANGQVLDTSDSGSVEQFRASKFGDRLLTGLAELRDEILGDAEMSTRIRKKFEIKCTTGYSMNAFTDYTEPLEILKHLLVGSEGTLAFLSSISLATVPEHRHKASSLLLFTSIQEACEAATMLKEAGAADAAELMDAASLAATNRQVQAGNQRLPQGLLTLLAQADTTSAALLVEVREGSATALRERVERVVAVLSRSAVSFDAGFSTDPVVCSSYWGVRKGLLPIAGSGRPRGSTLLLEDIAAPTDQLANLTQDVKDLFRSLDYEETVLFGHALDGNLHLLFSEEFSLGGESQRYASLMDRLCGLVVGKYDGSCKAEHGTGRNVAPFVEMEWGTPVWDLMWRVKDLFDPAAVLNPGVILNRDPTVHLKNIKPSPPVHDLVDECIECGFCESVCPSRDLTFTPRQRIAALRELESSRNGLPGCLDAGVISLEETMEYAVKDTCAGDSMCATKCPVGIDTGALVKDLRNASLSTAELRVGAYLARHMTGAMSSARQLLRIMELVDGALGAPFLSQVSRLVGKLSGALGVRLPQWQPGFPAPNSTFVRDWKECLAEKNLDAELAYLPSCSTRCMGGTAGSGSTSTTAAILSLLKKANTPVVMSPACDGLCCGLAWESRGMPEIGDEMARQYLNEAVRMMGKERRVLVDSSPCLERLNRFAKKQGDDVQLIGTVEVMQFLKSRLDWQPRLSAVEVHVPCSAKIGQGAAGTEAAISELLRGTAVPDGAPITSSGVACCGMAGDRGLRFPELVQAATSSRGPRLEESPRSATRMAAHPPSRRGDCKHLFLLPAKSPFAFSAFASSPVCKKMAAPLRFMIGQSMVVLFVAIIGLVGVLGQDTTWQEQQAMVDQMMLFQQYQQELDAPGAASLFVEDAVARIPGGVGFSALGRDQIEANFASYFATLSVQNETITSPVEVNGSIGAFAKTISSVRKSDGCVSKYSVVNWFNFEPEPSDPSLPLLTAFTAIYNSTSVYAQCP